MIRLLRSPRIHIPRPGMIALIVMILGEASPSGATDVTFRFRPPAAASSVSVAGYFNDWNKDADLLGGPDSTGVWQVLLDLPPGMHAYKFVVSGTDWIADPFATEFTDDGFGGQNSMLLLGEDPMIAGEPAGYALEASEAAGLPRGPVGAEVTFRFQPAVVNVNAVSLAGSFNGWDAAANRMADEQGDGLWEAVLRLPPGNYAYQFVVNGDQWFTDEFATEYEKDGFGGRNALIRVGSDAAEAGHPGSRIPR